MVALGARHVAHVPALQRPAERRVAQPRRARAARGRDVISGDDGLHAHHHGVADLARGRVVQRDVGYVQSWGGMGRRL